MASVGIRRRVSRRTGLVTYQVWWLLDDGSQGAETVASKDQARALAAQKRLQASRKPRVNQITRDSWQGRRRGRLPFSTWADLWWADWSADPHRSPHTLVMAESRLRNHVRPFFGDRAIDKIGPAEIRRWQTQLASTTGHATVQQCRSLLLRIFQYAVDEGVLDANPVRKVAVPKRRTDPEEVFGGQARRRALTPEEAGQLLARFPLFWWDHVLTLLGIGLRFGELAGLRRRRVRSTAPRRWSRWLTSATRPAASAAASNRHPRATPASVRSHWPAGKRRFLTFGACNRPGAGPGLSCWFVVEPPAGIGPATPSLPSMCG
jgi:hypothetical protein